MKTYKIKSAVVKNQPYIGSFMTKKAVKDFILFLMEKHNKFITDGEIVKIGNGYSLYGTVIDYSK